MAGMCPVIAPVRKEHDIARGAGVAAARRCLANRRVGDVRRLPFGPLRRSRLVTPSVGLAYALVGLIGLAACSHDGRVMRAPRADQTESIITTTVAVDEPAGFDTAQLPSEEFQMGASWAEGERIPVQFTCRGSGMSPSVSWFDPPAGTAAIALVFYEDGPTPIVNWIVANIDPALGYIDVGGLDGGSLAPAAFDPIVGLNDPSDVEGPLSGYRAPCPAAGTSSSYVFEVHALGQLIELPNETPARDLRAAIDLATIAQSSITAYAED